MIIAYWKNRQVNVKSQKRMLLTMVGECTVVGRIMPPASHQRCPHPNTSNPYVILQGNREIKITSEIKYTHHPTLK